MARKLAAKAAPAKPERDPITLPEAASFTSDVRTLAVNVTILLAIVLVVPVIVTQFWRSQVVIEPIAVPGGLSETGLTAEIAAGRLWDGIEAVSASAGTAKATVVSIPESAKVDFAIPDSGLSIDSLVYYVRQFFHVYETRVSGEFRCADPSCAPEGVTLRIRVIDDDVNLIDMPARGDKSEDTYFREAAAEVLSYLDPFTALAAVSVSDPVRSKVLARRLIRTKHPDAKWAHNLLGNLLQNEGDLAAALSEYDAALAIDANFAQALANRGATLLAQKDHAGAKQAFDRVLARDKNDIYALSGYADLMLAEDKPDEAVAYLRRAAEIRPLPPDFLGRAGMLLYEKDRLDEAEVQFKQALEVDPGDPLSLAALALIYLRTGRAEDAAIVYGVAADFSPNDASIRAQRATTLLNIEKFDEGLANIQRALELDPEVAGYHRIAARALLNLGRLDEALVEIDTAERMQPNYADNFIVFGDVYRLQGKTKDALTAYRKFLELAPADDVLGRANIETQIVVLEATAAAASAQPTPGPTPEAPPDAAASTQP